MRRTGERLSDRRLHLCYHEPEHDQQALRYAAHHPHYRDTALAFHEGHHEMEEGRLRNFALLESERRCAAATLAPEK